jgi:putative ABC transport system ATP-binding protein
MISLQGLTKTYETPAGSYAALRGIDLEIGKGELAAVVGKSGSGKSTLLNMIGGIDQPSGGSLAVDGTDVSRMRSSHLASWRGRTVGFVFQFFQLLPTLTAAENVMLPMDFCGTFPAREREGRARQLLARLGIEDQADKLPCTLSGGQQQRVAIARALANDPPLILADEPTGNLDSETSVRIFELLAELASQGKTVVVVTHEREVAAIAARVVTMVDGRVA